MAFSLLHLMYGEPLSPHTYSSCYVHSFCIRSYGVLLWEIVTYGQTPLEGLDTQAIVNKAEDKTLRHLW